MALQSRAAVPDTAQPLYVSQAALTIRSKSSPDICLDVAGSDRRSGTPIRAWTCNQSDAQKWSQHTLADGSINFRALDRCLHAAAGGSNADDTRVQLWKCLDIPSQQWTYDAGGTITNSQSGKCLYAPAGTQVGALVTLKTCDTTDPGQLWTP
jgi:hypothetical protein